MKINSLKKTRYNNCFTTFDNGETISLSMDIAVKYQFKKGMDIDEEMLEKIKVEQQLIESKRIAHNYISYKPRSEHQVRQRLQDKGYPQIAIDDAIAFLYDFNYLDDEKFAKMFASDYIQRKPSGKIKLRMELLKKGIDETIIDKTLYTLFENTNDSNLIRAAAEKKIRQISYKPLEKQKTAVFNYLVRQGFDYDAIKNIISDLF